MSYPFVHPLEVNRMHWNCTASLQVLIIYELCLRDY